ncbi:hypothetical protein BO221_03120 [Archangium sp. Cb G35]|uniref:hypothetical protein n=1 Tax=Archangium sp. Cb G35 TaxID=1920190 RepID=UPI000937B283|nr:hypothetical protein [Archangium sp. Cb G35]OJT27008.1 hypothetical protein BO221_03120 [Archangium sp. Cb G35]
MAEEREARLLATPPEAWHVRDSLVVGWYDGPTEGFCWLEPPGARLYFSLLEERHNPHGLDDRLFTVHLLSPGTYEVLQPLFDFEGGRMDPVREERLDREVKQAIASATPLDLLVYTQNWRQVLGCWRRSAYEPRGRTWFETLGIE